MATTKELTIAFNALIARVEALEARSCTPPPTDTPKKRSLYALDTVVFASPHEALAAGKKAASQGHRVRIQGSTLYYM